MNNGKGKHWRNDELELMLTITEKILPRGSNEWERIAEEFNNSRSAGMNERDADAIRNKFKSLKNMRKPTGAPTIPPSVKKAKAIQKAVEQRMSVITFDDEELLHDEEDEEKKKDEEDYPDDSSEEVPVPSQSSERPSIPKAYATPLRTGYNETELIHLGKSLTQSDSTRKRQKLDSVIESVSSNSGTLLQFCLLQEQRRDEERREERKRQEEREEENQRREEERQRREEEKQRRDEEKWLLILALLGKRKADE